MQGYYFKTSSFFTTISVDLQAQHLETVSMLCYPHFISLLHLAPPYDSRAFCLRAWPFGTAINTFALRHDWMKCCMS